jgi:hypothetical protein
MKHSPLIRLQRARRDCDLAAELCPHWDYESDGYGHDCCRDLANAEYELQQARKAVARSQKAA